LKQSDQAILPSDWDSVLDSSAFALACPSCKCARDKGICSCGWVYVPETITLEAYRGKTPLSAELEANAKDLLTKVNSLLKELGTNHVNMTSGYRSPEHNAAVGGKKLSNHMTCKAIDLLDNDRSIAKKIECRTELLSSRGMAMEDPAFCVTKNGQKWIHLQSVLPKSGRLIFIP
jgi:hypothetical protein